MGNKLALGLLAILLCLEAYLLFAGLGNAYLWEDEANTACFARNVLRTGLPTAWDGVNLISWHEGLQLSDNLVNTAGWLQYYLAAASFAVFGQGTAAARLPFAALGLLTTALFYVLATRYLGSRSAALLSTLFLALSVPFLLYARNARYYGPAILLATVCWFLSVELSLARRWKLVLFVICSALLFHANFLVFVCFFGALFVAGLLFRGRKRRLIAMTCSVPFVLVLTLPWYLWLRPGGSADVYFLANLRRGSPIHLFYGYLRDYNTFGFFPALGAVILMALIPKLWRRDRFMAQRLLAAIALTILFTGAFSVLSPQVFSPDLLADMRYAAILLPVFAIITGTLCHAVLRWRPIAGVLLVVVMLFTDLLSLRHFAPLYSEMTRISSPLPLPFRCYLGEYIHEITHDRTTPTEAAVRWLSERATPGELAVTSPPDEDDTLIFYLGDKLRLCGQLNENDAKLMSRWRDRLPAYVYSPRVVPDWIVYFNKVGIRSGIQEYISKNNVSYEIFRLPVMGDDTSRPEIPQRTFKDPTNFHPDSSLLILRRRPDSGPASGPEGRGAPSVP